MEQGKDSTANKILRMLELSPDPIFIQWIDGKIDYLRKTFDGPMEVAKFVELVNQIEDGQQRGKMRIEKHQTGLLTVNWERSMQ